MISPFTALVVMLAGVLSTAVQASEGPLLIGEPMSKVEQRALSRDLAKRHPRQRCEGRPTFWKGSLETGKSNFIIVCEPFAFVLDAQGQPLTELIWVGDRLQCHPSTGALCEVSVHALPSVRERSSDVVIRTPYGCTEVSWKAKDDRMYSSGVRCQESTAELVARKANCLQQGGTLKSSGLSFGIGSCVTPTKDAGKVCKGDWECENVCLGSEGGRPGVCAPTTEPTGCKTYAPKICSEAEKASGCKDIPALQVCQ